MSTTTPIPPPEVRLATANGALGEYLREVKALTEENARLRIELRTLNNTHAQTLRRLEAKEKENIILTSRLDGIELPHLTDPQL
jgi:regulator of replication initiation timing